jgi:hypothetical protein
VTPRWKATAGVIAVQARHSDPERRINNIDTESVELGGAHVTPLDNSAGLFVRYEHGRMPEPEVLQGFPLGFDNEYNQYGLGTNVVWNPAGIRVRRQARARAPRVQAGHGSQLHRSHHPRALHVDADPEIQDAHGRDPRRGAGRRHPDVLRPRDRRAMCARFTR